MTRLAVARALQAVPLLFGIATLTFFLTRVLPGDPTYGMLGSLASPELVKSTRHDLGFDKPLWDQFTSYLGDVCHFDFGTSIVTGRPVSSDFADRLPATLELIVLALTLAIVLGVLLGALAARRRGRLTDKATRTLGLVLLSVPDFWLGILLLYFFFFRWRIAPAPFGQLGPTDPVPDHVTGAAVLDSILDLNAGALGASLAHAALPVITLGLVLAAPIMRLTRSAMLEVLDADYVRFGRACGLPGHVLWRYAVRASLPPVVTLSGLIFTFLLGGAVLIETIFSWGGAAQYAATAVLRSDYAAIQGFVLISGVISVIVFYIVDLLYMAIDPRVSL